MSYKDEIISAFAFNVGKQIELIIEARTNELSKTNQQLEAKILSWYTKNGKDEKFAKHFGIKTMTNGSNETT